MAGRQQRICAPWTAQQVSDLNAWQAGERLHPFTCGAEHHLGLVPKLRATEDGWACPELECGYRQDWAYLYMAMSDHMVTWGVECEGCADLLDRCYEADMRVEAAEARVAELEKQILERQAVGVYATGKLGATERKLAATEELLAVAKQEIAMLERQLRDSQASYETQAKNTGAFWAAARAAEGKLEAIRGLVEGTRATSRATLATAVREVLDAE